MLVSKAGPVFYCNEVFLDENEAQKDDKKRKIEEVAGSAITQKQQTAKRGKKLSAKKLDEVKCLNQSEFLAALSNIENSENPFNRFLSQFTKIKNNNYMVWVDFSSLGRPETWLELRVQDKEYDSQCFAEVGNGKKYHFITLEKGKKIYLQIRIDQGLQSAEIIHIEKHTNISGWELKSFGNAILDFLKPAVTCLADDSKITGKKHTLYLRVLLPIASEKPRTWYSNDGFTLMTYGKRTKNLNGGLLVPQDEKIYQKAVSTLRDATLKSQEKAKTSQLTKLVKKYLPGKTLQTCTVHQLMSKIYSGKDPSNRDDLATAYQLLLTRTETRSPYQDALGCLYDYQIWARYSHSAP